jgi:hypothetical protein
VARPRALGYDLDMHASADASPGTYQDEWGNDLTLLDYFLALSPAARLDAWESFANDVADLQQHAHVLAQTTAPDDRRTRS